MGNLSNYFQQTLLLAIIEEDYELGRSPKLMSMAIII